MSAPLRLVFGVGGATYATDLGAVIEILEGTPLALIPLVPLEVGGLLALRGEPLPAVDGGVLLGGAPSRARGRILVLEEGEQRVGVTVDEVSGIERIASEPPVLEGSEPERACPIEVRWVRGEEGVMGLVDAAALMQRAAALLQGRGEPWPREC